MLDNASRSGIISLRRGEHRMSKSFVPAAYDPNKVERPRSLDDILRERELANARYPKTNGRRRGYTSRSTPSIVRATTRMVEGSKDLEE